MNEESIKSFLVDLGFKVDEPSLKKFAGTIDVMTKKAAILGAGVTAAVTAVAIAVNKYAGHMEDLYYASQRTETSVQNLKALEFAAQNLGASAGDAAGSIEALGHFRFSTPGWEKFLNNIGVSTRDAKGHLKDMGQILVNLGQRLAKEPTYMQQQYASMLGINYKMLRAITNPQFAAQFEKSRQITKESGTDLQKASEEAHKFENNVRSLEQAFGILWTKIEAGFQESLSPVLKMFTHFVLRNIPAVAHAIDEIPTKLSDLGLWEQSIFHTFAKDVQFVIDKLDTLGGKIEGIAKHPLDFIKNGLSYDWGVVKHAFERPAFGLLDYGNSMNAPPVPAGRWPWSSQGAAAGGSTVNVQQKTDIHVLGGSSPEATGKAVAGQQDRVNERMTRNLKGRVR